ncbi:TonB family protein [Desulfovibrio sp.]|uniref:TonB family protein n=1 Tax=Desulfovibrio sp. TaxID=885 RepID=UPI0025BE5FDD|nr:TonB family protein [Desulfovibrio sp.]
MSCMFVTVALLLASVRPPSMALPAAAAGPIAMSMRFADMQIRHERPVPKKEKLLLAEESTFTVPVPPVAETRPEPPKPVLENPVVKPQPPVAEKPAPRKPPVQKRESRQAQPAPDAKPGPRNQAGHPDGSRDGGIEGGVLGGVPGGVAGGVPGGVVGGVVGGSTDVPATARNMALSKIVNAVERYKNYPKQARRIGAEGLAILQVSVDAQGRVTVSSLHKSSGQASLDSATRELGEKLAGLDTGVRGAAFSVRVPVEYKLR